MDGKLVRETASEGGRQMSRQGHVSLCCMDGAREMSASAAPPPTSRHATPGSLPLDVSRVAARRCDVVESSP